MNKKNHLTSFYTHSAWTIIPISIVIALAWLIFNADPLLKNTAVTKWGYAFIISGFCGGYLPLRRDEEEKNGRDMTKEQPFKATAIMSTCAILVTFFGFTVSVVCKLLSS